jgi:prevent-host-death family protein
MSIMKAPQSEGPLEVGIRELRDHLSSWLDDVKEGREIVVTDRGQAVARLIPASRPARLQELIDRGTVTMPRVPRGPASSIPKVLVPRIDIDAFVRDQRR